MKLIDSYLVGKMARPLAYCLMAFAMIFVVFDLFDNLSLFLDKSAPLSGVVVYYAWMLPGLLLWIAPISTLLAVLYSLWQLSRRNELTAMRASGVGYSRLMAPLLSVALAISASVLVVNEFVAPRTMYRAYQYIQRMKADEESSARYALNLSYRNEAFRRTWAIQSFDLRTFSMRGVVVSQTRKDGSDMEIIRAAEADWSDGQWSFYNVAIQSFDEQNRPIGPLIRRAQMQMGDYNEIPRNFVNEVKDPIFFNALEVRDYLISHPMLDVRSKVRMLVDMHSRLSMPWASIIVALFGIPCGIHTGRKGALTGVILALVSFFGFYILMTISSWMGKNETISPWLAAWLPNAVVFTTALVWMTRVR